MNALISLSSITTKLSFIFLSDVPKLLYFDTF